MSFIYLANPYTAPEIDDSIKAKEKMCERFEKTAKLTSLILMDGLAVFSPIVHGHYIAMQYDMPKDFDFWMNVDFAYLAVARELWIHRLEGWDTSTGVKAEMGFAKACHIPIRWVWMNKPETQYSYFDYPYWK